MCLALCVDVGVVGETWRKETTWEALEYNIKIIQHNLYGSGYRLDNVVRDGEKWRAVTYWLMKGPVS